MNNDIHISDSLKTLIASRGVSRTDLCEQIGLSESALSNYLNGRIPQSLDPIVSLAAFFDVSLDYLITGREHSRGGGYREIEHLLQHHTVDMEQRVEAQSDLFLRVIESFIKNTRTVVNEEIKKSDSFNSSILDEKQVWALERCAEEVILATPYMKNEVIYDPESDVLTPGRFFNYIPRCLETNPDLRYHFIVNTEPLLPKTIEHRFLALLQEHGVPLKNNEVRVTAVKSPIYAQFVIYRLNQTRLQATNELLLQRIQPSANDNREIGIIFAPSDQIQLNILMDKKNLQIAKDFVSSIGTTRKRNSTDNAV